MGNESRPVRERESPLTRSQQATLDALADTFAPVDADAVGTRALVAAALERLAPHRRKKLLLVLNLLANPLAGLALAGRPRPFVQLDHAHRERALLRMARIGPLRPAFDSFARLSLFAAYSVADPAGHSAIWERLGYPGPRGDVPAGAAPFPIAAPPLTAIAADAVIVGSGAGGGVAAALLAQAGLRVVVLEAGPAFEPVAACQREAESFAELYLEAGLASSDDVSVSILAGACVGGGTTVNWSTSLRLPPQLATRWAELLGRPSFAAELADAYDAVETRLGVTLATSHNRNNAVIIDGAAKLGWDARAIPRNAECQGDACGYCGFGCAYGNKRSTAVTYLRDAYDAGALVFARTRVERVRIEVPAGSAERIVRGVDAITEDGRAITVDAPLVVVAAGATQTPSLLRRSGLGRHPGLGRGLAVHPATSVAGRFDEPVLAWQGVLQSVGIEQLHAEGVLIEATSTPPGLGSFVLPGVGRALRAELDAADHLAHIGAMVADRPSGRVLGTHRTLLRYDLATEDAAKLRRAITAMGQVLFAAGAREVLTGLARHPRASSMADLLDIASRVPARELHIAAFHPTGSARMGADRQRCPVDADGRLRGAHGVYVADASVLPTCPEVNPQLTIMAMALGIADGIVRDIETRPTGRATGSQGRSTVGQIADLVV